MLRPTILAIILLGCSHQLTAQQEPLRPSFGVEYTGELQTDFERIRWVHLLQLRAELPLTRQVTFNVSSISLAHSDEEPICYDLQGYSNIEAWNIPFILSVAGFTWQMNDSHSLFAGIRRIDEDYFNSDGLALFVNSSCGGFPTIVGNFFTPAYPMASMGVHYVYEPVVAGCYTHTAHTAVPGRAGSMEVTHAVYGIRRETAVRAVCLRLCKDTGKHEKGRYRQYSSNFEHIRLPLGPNP